MIKNDFNSGSDIAWETVRSKKNNKASNDPRPITNENSNINEKKNTQNAELNENYVPRAVREELDNILFSSDSVYEKTKNLNKKVNGFVNFKKTKNNFSQPQIDWKKRLNIYIIHKCCKQNKHEIIASIIDNTSDYTVYSNAVSSTLSGNTCLFDAAYYGSDVCMNYLINRGADIKHKNKLGENIYDIINTGMKDAISRYPNASEIVKARFEECIRLVKQAEDGNNKSNNEKKEENNFNDTYDYETLKEDIIKYIETPTVFRSFIDHIKKINLTDLLCKVLDDEDLEDILIDNPYVIQLV